MFFDGLEVQGAPRSDSEWIWDPFGMNHFSHKFSQNCHFEGVDRQVYRCLSGLRCRVSGAGFGIEMRYQMDWWVSEGCRIKIIIFIKILTLFWGVVIVIFWPVLACPVLVLSCSGFLLLVWSCPDLIRACPVLSMFMAVFIKWLVLSTWHVCLKLKIPYHLKMSGNMFFYVFWCQGYPKSIWEWS